MDSEAIWLDHLTICLDTFSEATMTIPCIDSVRCLKLKNTILLPWARDVCTRERKRTSWPTDAALREPIAVRTRPTEMVRLRRSPGGTTRRGSRSHRVAPAIGS